jgi:hypothetical protein
MCFLSWRLVGPIMDKKQAMTRRGCRYFNPSANRRNPVIMIRQGRRCLLSGREHLYEGDA